MAVAPLKKEKQLGNVRHFCVCVQYNLCLQNCKVVPTFVRGTFETEKLRKLRWTRPVGYGQNRKNRNRNVVKTLWTRPLNSDKMYRERHRHSLTVDAVYGHSSNSFFDRILQFFEMQNKGTCEGTCDRDSVIHTTFFSLSPTCGPTAGTHF